MARHGDRNQCGGSGPQESPIDKGLNIPVRRMLRRSCARKTNLCYPRLDIRVVEIVHMHDVGFQAYRMKNVQARRPVGFSVRAVHDEQEIVVTDSAFRFRERREEKLAHGIGADRRVRRPRVSIQRDHPAGFFGR
jgi:hypothetical protein